MKYRILLLLLFMLPLQLLHAQSKNDNQQKFLEAKNLFRQEQYVQAMEAFRELAAVQKNNSFAEYASFYYALSALEAGRLAEARAMLQQIRRKYAGWDQQQEVSYWLTRVYLEEKQYNQAIKTLQEISNPRIKADAQEMVGTYLAREDDVAKLKSLLQQFPRADYIAEVLAGKISRQPLPVQDQEFLGELVKKYNLDQALLKHTRLGTSEMKEEYHVAALLPFLYNDLQPEGDMHRQYFVLDMYEGMKIAREELDSMGINIALHAFDTRRDSIATRRLLNAPAMKKMDLIVGPLFPAPSKMVLNFAMENGINIVNPLSFNPEIISNNPYSFLFKPSLITQGNKAAEFASRTFEKKNALVIFGPSDKDSILAHSYQQAIEEKGFTVNRMVKIPAGEESSIQKLLVPGEDNPDAMKEGGKLHKDSIGHVFVASDDDLIVANVLSAVMARGDGLPVIGLESWLRNNYVSYDQLELLGVYFLAPNYIDYTSDGYKRFRKKYMEEVNNLPSRYAFVGYDLMMYYGRMMHQYGNLFQQKAGQEPYQKGIFCTGYSFAKGNDNQCVPIVKLKDSALEIVFQ